MITPALLFTPLVLVLAVAGIVHQSRCAIAPRHQRSRVDRPILVLLTFAIIATVAFVGVCLASHLALEAKPIAALARRASQTGWLLLPVSVPFFIRAIRLWRTDHAATESSATNKQPE